MGPNIVVSVANVQRHKDDLSMKLFQYLFNSWKRVVVTLSLLVHFVVVLHQLEGAILLLDEKHWYCPLRLALFNLL